MAESKGGRSFRYDFADSIICRGNAFLHAQGSLRNTDFYSGNVGVGVKISPLSVRFWTKESAEREFRFSFYQRRR